MMDRGCCDAFDFLDFTKMEWPVFLFDCKGPHIDWTQKNLAICAFLILFSPLFWISMARLELKTKLITRFCGSARSGCVFLAATIIVLAVVRGRRYQLVLYQQPVWRGLQTPMVQNTGAVLTALGLILTFSSFISRGFYGTFLGNYFGVLMEHRGSFPYNLMAYPMYWGTVMEYLGYALWSGPSPAGLFLSLLLALCYKIALFFEISFRDKIEIYVESNTKKID